jgi:hypothetical protein
MMFSKGRFLPGWPVRRGVSKGVEDGRRPLALWAGHPRNSHKAVLGVVHPQGVEGSGMAGSGEILGSPWIPLAIGACFLSSKPLRVGGKKRKIFWIS